MIDPNSLRKDNWIEHHSKKRIVEEIGKSGIDFYGDLDGEVYSDRSQSSCNPFNFVFSL